MDGIALSVIAGLAVGIGFVLMLGLWQAQLLLSDNPPRAGFYLTDNSWVLLETSRIEMNDYNRQVIDVMLKNSTLVELVNGEYVLIVGMGESNCLFGPCAQARLSDIEDRARQIELTIDPAKD